MHSVVGLLIMACFSGTVEPAPGVDLEGLEVAKECLSEVFKIDASSVDRPGQILICWLTYLVHVKQVRNRNISQIRVVKQFQQMDRVLPQLRLLLMLIIQRHHNLWSILYPIHYIFLTCLGCVCNSES